MIYKAIEGTTMYDAFEDKLIFGECIERIARERTYCDGVMHYEFESRQDVYNQIREATNQEIADEFNKETEFDDDLFEELSDRAGIEMDEYINASVELDRDKWQEDVSNKLGIKLC